MAKKRNEFRLAKEVRKLARERVGPVPPARVIEPKKPRRKGKHPKREEERWREGV